jgi:hypothetical protein
MEAVDYNGLADQYDRYRQINSGVLERLIRVVLRHACPGGRMRNR